MNLPVMATATAPSLPASAGATLRPIEARIAAAAQHGPIIRLIDPGDLGERLNPFIFLDHFKADVPAGFGFGWHPHSGIATLTWQPDRDIAYEDTTGQAGTLPAGGLEWMNAGGGAWHRGHFKDGGPAQGFQLWVAMPAGVENDPPEGHYVAPADVPRLDWPGGNLQVLLGEVTDATGTVRSPIDAHQDMTYAVLTLQPGATWQHRPPVAHDVAWAFAFDGTATVQGQAAGRDLLVLGDAGDLVFTASGDTPARIVWGTARQHPAPLVLGSYSVHTSPAALRAGQARIREIGLQLRRDGRLG